MIKFDVTLSESDIKKFISNKMGLRTKKVILPFVVYFFALVTMVIATIFADFGITGWGIIIILLFILIFGIYRIYSTFQTMFVFSLDIVGKDREFTMDRRSLHVIYSKNIEFSGQYPIYDLDSYKKEPDAYYLIFKDKVYIIIPRRFLDSEQDQELNSILEEACPPNSAK